MPRPVTSDPFVHAGCDVDPAAGTVTCRYRQGEWDFAETFTFAPGGDWGSPAVAHAIRWLYLFTAISYYKTHASLTVDLGDVELSEAGRAFLREFYVDGLGEFVARNPEVLAPDHLDRLTFVGGRLPADAGMPPAGTSQPGPARPLIPFGGGLDSIVSVELLRETGADGALFIVNHEGGVYESIEEPAAVTGLPIVRATRRIDPQVLASRANGFLNGHVPVTAIISALAVVAAALTGRDAVVMSNEWSASQPTMTNALGRPVNHQWSKSLTFEAAYGAVLAEVDGTPDYFSLLRPWSELWIAKYFAEHCGAYLHHFRSCNRAFRIDAEQRAAQWCGECDKCAFIDLIVAPFVAADELDAVFVGREPLRNEAMLPQFDTLLGLVPNAKPWECVGDVVESRAAIRLAAARPDRAGNPVLARLVADSASHDDPPPADLLRPLSEHRIPDRYATAHLLG